MSWAAVAGAVIGVVGGVVSSKKASSGAKKASKNSNQYIAPYADAGRAGLPAVQQFVNEGANFSDTQAYKDIINSAKAGGMSLSGNRLTALTDYYATNFRPQRLNELMALPQLGANAAAGQATNAYNSGIASANASAAGYLSAANSIQNGLNNYAFMQAWQNQNSNNSLSTNGQAIGGSALGRAGG